ncbi:MAG: methionine synthase [Planctomycetota bacterium]|nr:MAG: methionine synthase [Planctomycetota bacterium]
MTPSTSQPQQDLQDVPGVRSESEVREALEALLQSRILVMDGAMGTLLQGHALDEAAYRGSRLADHPLPLQGNHDVLNLTQPDLVQRCYQAYLEAGADIIETNTFNATAVSQGDYECQDWIYEINLQGARLARQACREVERKSPEQARFVAGSLGPTNKTLSLSPKVEDPAFRDLDFAAMAEAYAEQSRGLIDGGVDLLLLETIFDTLCAKAALFAMEQVFQEKGRRLPIMISATISDQSGRLLSGQSLEAFVAAVEHAQPFSLGLNCALGATQMRSHLADLARVAPTWVHAYPNAGLPNAFGEYDEKPQDTADFLAEWAASGLVNLVGGCCGTTPEHVTAVKAAVSDFAPRPKPKPESKSSWARFSGLDLLEIRPDSNFTLVGERTNVAGSRRFARLIREGAFEQALDVARQQVRGGANLLDVNMDEALLDGPASMVRFLRFLGSDPEIARLPIMIDSSDWQVLEAGLGCLQGKSIVNSLSLKDGEEVFLQRARRLRQYGAAVVVMAFDEEGQAESLERKVSICHRAYRLLTEQVGMTPQDIIFDANVLAIGTGLAEHDAFAVNFIEAVRQIKKLCPGSLTSGGISNLSFSFRGNDAVREAMHACFLYHAIQAGLDLGIVNAGQLAVYEDLDPDLKNKVEDLIFDRHPEATDALLAIANQHKPQKQQDQELGWRELPVAERLIHAMVHGLVDHVEEDAAEALESLQEPLAVIEGPLMDGMKHVGELFGSGQMFLPQVVRSARVMKKAVAWLTPYLEEDRSTGQSRRGKVLLATVKGDVHDIGKNIVSVVLACNRFEVVDLGVMVPCDQILETAAREQVDLIGLSGLITPSLEEMVRVADEMQRRELSFPLLIGGATTSRQHTAVKIAPQYAQPVVHVLDASRAVGVVSQLLDDDSKKQLDLENRRQQSRLRFLHEEKNQTPLISLQEARRHRPQGDWHRADVRTPEFLGYRHLEVPLGELVPYIDWTFFFHAWELKGVFPKILDDPKVGVAARELYDQGRRMLDRILSDQSLQAKAAFGFWPAAGEREDLVLFEPGDRNREKLRFAMLRQQRNRGGRAPHACLADWVAPADSGVEDFLGAFALTAGFGASELAESFEQQHDDFSAILVKALADRLAEACAEWLHQKARLLWGFGGEEVLQVEDLLAERFRGIRPAFGYPACPDHSEKFKLFDLLQAERLGLALTESAAMQPAASISGLYFSHPEARYFSVGRIGKDQMQDYADRKGISLAEAESWLAHNLGYEPLTESESPS